MPATISAAPSAPTSFSSPVSLARYGAAGSGIVFIDADGKTFIGTKPARELHGSCGMLKVVGIDEAGAILRMAESRIRWPLRIAPADHVVMIRNPQA